ncbi:histidinol dehydrogenase [Allomyces macrogynus ATCC 38327]|uniref:Histidine biosynthesis trifunctional protein n=1 Tax=Allomyces macrogynus (strain ATCC 38327) TaxID=578462 RepID=A0A0L0SXP1_ALLM3|nr:histidinol dehydrogenase [Allomyces macrogynus ATCC 38327]|eukprot:KNE67277.1 histidinol dehydrogenase [Allomyces macrogynus ATCC 38327]
MLVPILDLPAAPVNDTAARVALAKLSLFATVLVRPAAAGNALPTDLDLTSAIVPVLVALTSDPDTWLTAATTYLDSGAAGVLLDPTPALTKSTAASLAATLKASGLPASRIHVQLSASGATLSNEKELLDCIAALNSAVNGGYWLSWPTLPVAPVGDIEESADKKAAFLRTVARDAVKNLAAATKRGDATRVLTIHAPAVPVTAALIGAADKAGINIACPATQIALSASTDPALLDVGAVATAPLATDRPDGLFPTVVVDARGHALGLAYSSTLSVGEAIRTGQGVYHSRTRGLWYKGLTSGATQALLRIDYDCDRDTLQFVVSQNGAGFCHNGTRSCFGAGAPSGTGIAALAETLEKRMVDAPAGSYTRRLFEDEKLLAAKVLEEAQELVDARTEAEVAGEAADLIYFALARARSMGVGLAEIEKVLDMRARKVSRRPGNAKPKYAAAVAEKEKETRSVEQATVAPVATPAAPVAAPAPAPVTAAPEDPTAGLKMRVVDLSSVSTTEYAALLQRPILDSGKIQAIVEPIVEAVRTQGDKALLDLTKKFDKANLASPVLLPPFAQHYAPSALSNKVRNAIDVAMANVEKFHRAQLEPEPLVVETMPGVICTRDWRAIDRVGLYVPGGTAVLPSSTLMLGVPARVAGCKTIVVATPPRADGSVAPEVLYVADKIGAAQVVLAGGAQAVAAMAFGTESVLKVDKICGPGNQFVTAAKMQVQNSTQAMVAIDMPAGPSEVLVIADGDSDPRFVAADLLSQAEHGPDSQVVLVAVGMSDPEVARVEAEVIKQALQLPRVEIVRKCLPKSVIVRASTMAEAVKFSNAYAPEHLILNLDDNVAKALVKDITSAGSVFVGAYSPESCGDYASGTNHTLPTYGYAAMYSGVNTHTFVKHITTQHLSKAGLDKLADAVITLAEVEGLDAHARAVAVRVGRFNP